MRSELVTQAAAAVKNRFLLVHVTSAITRKFHRPTKDRLPESINNSLAGLAAEKYVCCQGVALSNIQPDGFDAAPIWAVRAGANWDTLAAFTSLTTGLPYFPPGEDETTPEERMAVSVALLNAPAFVETA